MSLFKGEFAFLDRFTLGPRGAITNATAPTVLQEGLVFNDVTQKTIKEYLNSMTQTRVGTVNVNATAVTNTNQTSATNLMAGFAFPAGTLNVAGKTVRFHAAGTYSLGAASTNVFKLNLGAVTLATFTSGSNTNTSVTLPWSLDATFATVTVGASGVVEFDGTLNINIGATAPVAETSYTVVGASSAVDLTAAATLQLQANLGSGNAASTQIQRLQVIEVMN